MHFVRVRHGDNKPINLWIGGSDQDEEGRWIWHTGELMQRGPPFWGTTGSYALEPSGGTGENCAGLYHRDHYYIHDFNCNINTIMSRTFYPLCEMSAVGPNP
ncbi:unnamed protein product [Meganyctiphanes norvegica]|uniref:C-type lectin domain-containing protein n=1 Tax=Meganyctiphanes norvegica TaxID=48144 RepID=A0AAV2Q610_MEGNR